jgi:hypothetical protein
MNIYDSPFLSPLTLIGLFQSSLLVSYRLNIIKHFSDYSIPAFGTQRCPTQTCFTGAIHFHVV